MDIDKLISDKDFWATTKVCVKVLLSTVKVLRFSDGIRGGNLGLMYNLLLQLDDLYSSLIDGLPEKVRTKVIYVSCDTEGICLFFFNIWSSTLFLCLSSTFFFYFDLQDQCRQIAHVLH